MPPKEWLIVSSLLWDKIWISPIIAGILSSSHLFPDFKDTFITRMFHNLDVFDFSDPMQDKDRLLSLFGNPEDVDQFKKVIEEYTEKILKNNSVDQALKLSEKAEFYRKVGNHRLALQFFKKAKEIMDLRYRAQPIIDEVTHFNHAFFNSKFKEAYSDLDYFFEKEKTFENYWPNSNKIFVYSVTALLPKEPQQISLSQIRDFRDKTVAERFRFKNEADKILREILQSTSEEALESSLRLFAEILNSEMDSLQKNYTDCKIQAIMKAIPILMTIPTLLVMLCQAVAIPIYEPGAIISGLSLAGASVMSSIESFRSEINKSPWGVLMPLGKI